MRRLWLSAAAGACLFGAACTPELAPAGAADDFSTLVQEPRTAVAVAQAIASGEATAASVTEAYLARIAAVDDGGPAINSVLALNPGAVAIASALDAAKAGGGALGPLHGVPIFLKDNIETLDPVATTAGSLALQDNITGRDSPLVARLRAAGAVILGKTNLSEWANFRDDNSTSGWSGVGGLTKNPHVLDRNPCGSSSGSGAAVAAGLAAAAIGTETNGSIVCPASANGVVGLKPTVGLVPRTHIVPISASQDTAGPMTLTVADAALLLTVMAGSDPSDPATVEADARKSDYTQALDPDALRGKRIGVARFLAGYHPATDAAFEAALEQMTAAGAELVEIKELDRGGMSRAQMTVLLVEFREGLNAYLASTPDTVTVRSLDDLIAFNDATPAELEFFGQSLLPQAAQAPALDSPEYLTARADAKRLAGPEGIDKLLADNNVEALVAPTGGPAWTTDLITGDRFLGSASSLAAISGYPHITVPMGDIRDLPVGLSIFGPAWSEAKLIGFAYAFEQRTQARKTPQFLPRSP